LQSRAGEYPHGERQNQAHRKRSRGQNRDWKKAIVTLAPGDKATRLKEIFEGA
jgi:ribosomal protein L23